MTGPLNAKSSDFSLELFVFSCSMTIYNFHRLFSIFSIFIFVQNSDFALSHCVCLSTGEWVLSQRWPFENNHFMDKWRLANCERKIKTRISCFLELSKRNWVELEKCWKISLQLFVLGCFDLAEDELSEVESWMILATLMDL